jgi:hypothetical protein
MFGGSEKVGKIQRFVGHSSQEEQKMVATLKQSCAQNTKGEIGFEQKKKVCRSKYNTQTKNGQTGLNGNS